MAVESGVERLNSLAHDEAEAELLKCCGSTAWACAVAARRPFASEEELMSVAEEVWSSLEADDWLEAFSRHPKIGEKKVAPQTGTEQAWSAQEQAGMRTADSVMRDELAELNELYEATFGHVFLICATGKTPEEMLGALKKRIGNDKETELRVAAEEQRQITRLRLRKLLAA